MKMIIYNKVRVRATITAVAGLLLTVGCEDEWRNNGTADEQQIHFAASVVSSRQDTRADGSVVNRMETSLPGTKYDVGVFGCYTGQDTWATLDTAESGSQATANFMFNQRMKVGSPSDGVNALDYFSYNRPDSLLRFWPNNPGDKVSFWAYYPYNPTDDPGTYGVAISTNASGYGVKDGTGMGTVKFTMHPDASQQNDFMVSDLVADCTKGDYPLLASGTPTPVRFRLHHLLAQVRLYAFIRGTDRLVYKDNAFYAVGQTYTDAWGKGHTVTADEANTIPVIDEENSKRWSRLYTEDGGSQVAVTSPSGNRIRANISLSMSFNNIHTSCVFTPHYDSSTGRTTFTFVDQGTLGSATVNQYIQNPYWFEFDETDHDKRVRLNDEYMYGYFEDTDAKKDSPSTTSQVYRFSLTNDKLKYLLNDDVKGALLDVLGSGKHYNYAPGNIILAVPQVMSDDDVPNITITATGKRRVWSSTENKWVDGETITAKVTINMLQMRLKWESGFIYCYAFIDDLMPDDDKVRGPESITVVFDESKQTDQW